MLIIEARLFLWSCWCGTRRRRRWIRTGSWSRGILQLSLFEEAVLWMMLELELRNLVLVSLVRVVCQIMGSFRSADLAGSRNRNRSLSAELGSRLSRFNGSSWISFSSLHACQTDSKPEVPVDQSSEFGHDEQPVQLESGEPVVHASDDHEVRGRVPLVLRSESEERVVHTSEEHEACERLPLGSSFPRLGGRGQNF